MSLTTVVVLTLLVTVPDKPTSHLSVEIGTIDECWDIARELTASAENGPLQQGGTLTASCTVSVKPTVEH